MKKLEILYEDKDIIAINKPTKLLSISNGKSNDTLYKRVSDYVKKQHKSNKIFIVHRLDKDTSGVIVFAKNEAIKRYLQDNWANITREYIAITSGIFTKKKGILRLYLKENKVGKVYVVSKKYGKYCETYYEVIKECKDKSLLKINITTGRKNQIRASLSYIGHPIIGDKKYGSNINDLKRLGLHASKLILKLKNKNIEIIAKKPQEFNKYFN